MPFKNSPRYLVSAQKYFHDIMSTLKITRTSVINIYVATRVALGVSHSNSFVLACETLFKWQI